MDISYTYTYIHTYMCIYMNIYLSICIHVNMNMNINIYERERKRDKSTEHSFILHSLIKYIFRHLKIKQLTQHHAPPSRLTFLELLGFCLFVQLHGSRRRQGHHSQQQKRPRHLRRKPLLLCHFGNLVEAETMD